MMVRAAFVSAICIFASGCQTINFGADNTLTLVTTEPAGAIVRVEGFGECEAPCTIELDAPRNLTIAKAGYKPQSFVLQPGKRKVDVILELSAPTTNVDTTELPEI